MSARAIDSALLHAAGELPGIFFLEALQIDEIDVARGAGLPLVAGKSHDLERQADVALDRAPGIKSGRLENIAIVRASGAPLPGFTPFTAIVPRRAFPDRR